ncbi:MAG: hypothetical protein ACR2MX_08870 [Cyclobacteriaceae bacterium]
MELAHRIFGKNIKIDLNGLPEAHLLQSELDLYPSISVEEKDLVISHVSEFDHQAVERANPSAHRSLTSGFGAIMGTSEVQFLFENDLLDQVNFSFVSQKESKFLKALEKLRSIQYLTDREAIGQVFHELILVPSVFFDPSLVMVHASGVVTPKNETILFAGTGGVGKTSLELELCINQNCHFLSDDICIVSDKGKAYPNLAYPKVYAYNMNGNTSLKKAVFKKRNALDKLQWYLMSKRGLHKARRRISPRDFYGEVVTEGSQLDKYIVLSREKVNDIQLEILEANVAAKLNARVIQSEYGVFLNHIYWHQYNCYLAGTEPYCTSDKIFNNMEHSLTQGLNKCQVYKLKIPVDLDHTKFVKRAVSILSEELQIF